MTATLTDPAALRYPTAVRSPKHHRRAGSCGLHLDADAPMAVATVANVPLCQHHLDTLHAIVTAATTRRTWTPRPTAPPTPLQAHQRPTTDPNAIRCPCGREFVPPNHGPRMVRDCLNCRATIPRYQRTLRRVAFDAQLAAATGSGT